MMLSIKEEEEINVGFSDELSFYAPLISYLSNIYERNMKTIGSTTNLYFHWLIKNLDDRTKILNGSSQS